MVSGWLPNGFQMDIWIPDGYRMETEWFPDGNRMVSKFLKGWEFI